MNDNIILINDKQYLYMPASGTGTKERNWLGWSVFGRENFILKTMTFRSITTVLNEKNTLKWSSGQFQTPYV